MKQVIFVPIEVLEERYSAQWLTWFSRDFKALGLDPIIVGAQDLRKIRQGQFLDVFETCKYKTDQMAEILTLVEAGFEGTIFFMDGWFPGIEHLAYIRSNANRKLNLVGILHAGTWDPWDFLTQNGCREWAHWLESAWLIIFDRVLVATEFHKEMIEDARGLVNASGKIKVVKFPCYRNDALRNETPKENIVLFPHRLAPEKRPQEFEEVTEIFRQRYPKEMVDLGIRFLRTKDACKTKAEYYELLARSRVVFSSADQETFGIAMLEGVALGCWPVAPDRLSYRETLAEFPRYNNLGDAADLILRALLQKDLPAVCYSDATVKIIQAALE